MIRAAPDPETGETKVRGAEERPGGETITTPLAEDVGDGPLSRDLSANIVRIETAWGHAADLVVRRFSLRAGPRAALVFLKGQVDDARPGSVRRPALAAPAARRPCARGPGGSGRPRRRRRRQRRGRRWGRQPRHPAKAAMEHRGKRPAHHPIGAGVVFCRRDGPVAHGNALLLVHGENEAIAINVHSRAPPQRGGARHGAGGAGPREGFIEDLGHQRVPGTGPGAPPASCASCLTGSAATARPGCGCCTWRAAPAGARWKRLNSGWTGSRLTPSSNPATSRSSSRTRPTRPFPRSCRRAALTWRRRPCTKGGWPS